MDPPERQEDFTPLMTSTLRSDDELCQPPRTLKIISIVRHDSCIVLQLLIEGRYYETLLTSDHPLYNFGELQVDITDSPALI